MSEQTVVIGRSEAHEKRTLKTPFLADGIAIVLHLLLGGLLLGRFRIPPTDIPDVAMQTDETVQLRVLDGDAFINLLLLIGLYFCFLIGIFIIRKLRGTVDPVWHQNRTLFIIAALLFGLCLTLAMTEMTAFFDNIDTVQQMGEVGNGYIVMFTPAIFIFLSLLYLFLLTMPPEIVYESNRTAWVGLMGINLMMVGIASYVVGAAERLFALGNLPLLVLTAVLLSLLFTLPRLMYAARTKQWLSLLSYLLTLLAVPAISIFIHGY